MKNLISDNFLSFFVGLILGFFLNVLKKRLIGTNQNFFEVIENFKKKLPPRDKKAEISEWEHLTHMNLNTLSHNIESRDIDMFVKELEELDYKSLVFKKKKITEFSKNLQRIIKTTNWNDFLVGILSEMLEDKEMAKRKLYILGLKSYKYIKF
jgi:hypothetical protein